MPSLDDLLRARRAEREALLWRATDLLAADRRVVAAWLGGSLGRGEADDLSDLDLWVAVADEDCPTVVAGRREYASRFGRPLLVLEAPQNAPAGGGYLLTLYGGKAGPLQVDWYWQPRSTARMPRQARVLFDRAGLAQEEPPAPLTQHERAARVSERVAFFWAMAAITAKKIARGQPWAALALLSTVARTLDGVRALLGDDAGQAGYEDRRSDSPPAEPAAQLAGLRALAREMESLTPRALALGAEVPAEVVPQAYRFFDLADALLNGASPAGEGRR